MIGVCNLSRTRAGDAPAHTRQQASELIATYGEWKGDPKKQPAVLRPEELRAEHATEKYREAWEYLLLAPPSREVDFMHTRILDALERIANAKSTPALAAAFQRISAKEGRAAPASQARILGILAQLYDAQAFEGMLACLSFAEDHAGGGPVPAYGKDTLRQIALRAFVVDADNVGKAECDKKQIKMVQRWRSILEGYDKPDMPQRSREFLNEIKASYKRPKKAP
jgi:hypothetical protein